jgi:hypothetical protein
MLDQAGFWDMNKQLPRRPLGQVLYDVSWWG